MASVVLHPTRHGKGRLILSKAEVKKLEKAYPQSDYGFDLRLRVGKKVFIPVKRKDRRITIPAAVVKGNRMSGKPFRASFIPFKRDERMHRKVIFPKAKKRGEVDAKYYVEPIEEVRTEKIKLELIRTLQRYGYSFAGFYIRLSFIVQKTDGEVYSYVKTLTSGASPFGLLNLDVPESIATVVSRFVDRSFKDALEVKFQPYVEEVFFLKWSVTYENTLGKKGMRPRA